MKQSSTTAAIAELNDHFRRSFGPRRYLTPGIAALSPADQASILKGVMEFDDFTEENDPYGEHDFGTLEHRGLTIFWKIDYYDPALEHGSEDPADPAKTARVLTVMLADEW